MNLQGDIPLSLAVAAYAGTSMSPERRGAAVVAEFENGLAQDLALFEAQAAKGGTSAMVESEFGKYRARLVKAYRAWLASSSRCVSSFIAGPSNFPAARMNKRADIAHRRLGEYLSQRERARAAVIRNLRPDLAPIRSSDADAADKYRDEIAKLELLHAFMVGANKIVRAFWKAGVRDSGSGDLWGRYLEKLRELRPNISDAQAAGMLQPDFCGRIGFEDYRLKNNSANIRRLKERVEHCERLHALPVSDVQGTSARIEDDPPANRVRLFFPGKPAESVRADLKRHGFRWSQSIGAWQAFRNGNALETARRIAG